MNLNKKFLSLSLWPDCNFLTRYRKIKLYTTSVFFLLVWKFFFKILSNINSRKLKFLNTNWNNSLNFKQGWRNTWPPQEVRKFRGHLQGYVNFLRITEPCLRQTRTLETILETEKGLLKKPVVDKEYGVWQRPIQWREAKPPFPLFRHF